MVVMNFLFLIATSLQIKSIASKKYDTSSDESIENILFYKDFRPKKDLAPLPVEPLVLPTPPKQQPECIPRMCCSMSCTNTCGQNEMSVDNQNQHMQSMNPMNPMNPMNSMKSMNSMNSMMSLPLRQSSRLIPPFSQHKNKFPALPFQSRKTFGTAREHIKSLISKDEDIKKILKDLVRVTMKKVDLLEMIKARRASEAENAGLNDDDGKEL